MKKAHHIETLEERPSSLALGAFDGLHRGHMAVIRAAVAGSPGAAGAVTFDSSPSGAPALLTEEDKEGLLAEAGLDFLLSLRFSEVRDMPAEEFVRGVLFEKCHAVRLFCGEDFRFGRGARGDVTLLEKLCREAGARLTVVPSVTEGGEKISSTRIRAAVEAGDILLANRLLGRPFGYALEVIHGNHLGTGLGTPTINQAFPENFILPPFGVYASLAEIDGERYVGVTNIGVKPTVGSDRELSETWMPEFAGDLYGKKVRLSLFEYLRPEKKFASLEDLKAEIRKNGEQAAKIVKKTLQSEKTVVE